MKILKPQNKLEFFIITGVSGAGKTHALKSMEDFGVFCVDNLPLDLIPRFADLMIETAAKPTKIAIGIDIRAAFISRNKKEFFGSLVSKLTELKKKGANYRVIFLHADRNTLIRRFSETRRRHPLGKNLLGAIKREMKLLEPFRAYSDKVIDTSGSTLGELKSSLVSELGIKSPSIIINITAFGYKYGLPIDSDMVIDARFIPNPNYIGRFRKLTGNDTAVKKYVLGFPLTRNFLKRLCDFLDFLLPNYIKEGKSYLSIGFGCTGGRHRSVVIANFAAEYLRKKKYLVKQQHRDILK